MAWTNLSDWTNDRLLDMTKKPKSLHHRKLAFRSVDRGRPQGARAHWVSIKSSTLVIVRYIKLTENEYLMIDTIIRFSKRLFKSHFISLSDLGCFRRKSDLSWGGLVEIGISAIAFIQQPPWFRISPQKHKGRSSASTAAFWSVMATSTGGSYVIEHGDHFQRHTNVRKRIFAEWCD